MTISELPSSAVGYKRENGGPTTPKPKKLSLKSVYQITKLRFSRKKQVTLLAKLRAPLIPLKNSLLPLKIWQQTLHIALLPHVNPIVTHWLTPCIGKWRTCSIIFPHYPPPPSLIYSFPPRPPQTCNFNHLISPSKEEVANLINSTKSGSPCDPCPSPIASLVADTLAISLTDIFQHMCSSGSFPSVWKKARVLPLIKKNLIGPTGF